MMYTSLRNRNRLTVTNLFQVLITVHFLNDLNRFTAIYYKMTKFIHAVQPMAII